MNNWKSILETTFTVKTIIISIVLFGIMLLLGKMGLVG